VTEIVFTLAGGPELEPRVLSRLGEALAGLHLSPGQAAHLRAATQQALWRLTAQAETGPAELSVVVRVRAPGAARPAGVALPWGFFIVTRPFSREAAPGHPASLAIELILYQDRAQGASEGPPLGG